MADNRKNISEITITKTTLDGTEWMVGRDLAGNDFKIKSSDFASLAVSDMPIGTTLPFSGTTIPEKFLVEDGSSMERTTYNPLFQILTREIGNFSVTLATPAVFTLNGHGLETADNIEITTDGTLPTGLAIHTNYFIDKIDSNSFYLCLTRDDAVAGTNRIATSGTQSGTHTLRYTPYGINGANEFYIPDTRGAFLSGNGTHGTLTDYTRERLGIAQMHATQRMTGSIGQDVTGVGYLHENATYGVFMPKNSVANKINFIAGSGFSTYAEFDSANSTSPNPMQTDDYDTRPFNFSKQFIIKYK